MDTFDPRKGEAEKVAAKNEGGSAFPLHVRKDNLFFNKGMTLRDYFAAKAMQAIIAKSPFLAEPQTFDVYEKTAIGAYDYADKMLAEREKGGAK